MKLHLISGLVALVFVVASVNVLSNNASAGERFQKRHPRRAEVNGREHNQARRIEQGEKNGSLSPQESERIERQEGRIKRQERREVKANGGHLTRGEQRRLNKELNHENREINRDEHNGAQPAQPAQPAVPPANAQ